MPKRHKKSIEIKPNESYSSEDESMTSEVKDKVFDLSLNNSMKFPIQQINDISTTSLGISLAKINEENEEDNLLLDNLDEMPDRFSMYSRFDEDPSESMYQKRPS